MVQVFKFGKYHLSTKVLGYSESNCLKVYICTSGLLEANLHKMGENADGGLGAVKASRGSRIAP